MHTGGADLYLHLRLTLTLYEVVNFKPHLIYQWGKNPST